MPNWIHSKSIITAADNTIKEKRDCVPCFCSKWVVKVNNFIQPNTMDPVRIKSHFYVTHIVNTLTIKVQYPYSMLSIGIAIIASVFSHIFIRHLSVLYKFNSSFYLLIVETCKLLICFICMNCITRKKMKIRFGFLVNSLLYTIVNTLSFYIPNIIEPAIYAVLIQHKMLWVVILSSLMLNRRFETVQYVALFSVCWGCMLVKMSDASGDLSAPAVLMIITQGICSSMSSIWIEKMMKMQQRPLVSKDPKKQKVYWFLADSLQMYMFGIPIYAVSAYINPRPINIPFQYAFSLIVAGVIQGLSLGAIFVYYNSVVRSIISALVIIILAVLHGVFTTQVVLGIAFVVIGVVGYVAV